MTTRDERFANGMELFRELHPEAADRLVATVGETAPELMRLVAEVPFGDLYPRTDLSKRERQIATVACLASLGSASQQLAIHIAIARQLGIERSELVELFTQLAVYAGFPYAINAVLVASEVFAAEDARTGENP